jgi:hypothetical protein
MRGHDQMRQQALCRGLPRQRRQFSNNAIWSEIGQQFELRRARPFSAPVREIYDPALNRPVNRAVRLVDKTR